MTSVSPEVYVSVDIETDGPIPGDNSMLSLGAAAFKDRSLLGTFTENLIPCGRKRDTGTMAFWDNNPEAYAQATMNARAPDRVMYRFLYWVKELPGKPVFVGYPAGFDFLFVYWYLIHFTGESPFSFSALDMKSYAMAKLGTPYRKSTKKNWPKGWKDTARRHTHLALDDAIEQGYQFMEMLYA